MPVPMDRIPTEELKPLPARARRPGGIRPNGQNSDRGIETFLELLKQEEQESVPMDRIPTEELKRGTGGERALLSVRPNGQNSDRGIETSKGLHIRRRNGESQWTEFRPRN